MKNRHLFIGTAVLLFSCIFVAKSAEIMLRGFESNSGTGGGAWKVGDLKMKIVPAKFGNGMLVTGDAQVRNGKADITVMRKLPEELKKFSVWVWAPEDKEKLPRVFSWSVFDSQREKLSVKLPVDWSGWKKLELDILTAPWKQTYPQAKGNGKVDLPLKSLHLNWFASKVGKQEMIFDQLTGVVVDNDKIAKVASEYPLDNLALPEACVAGDAVSTMAVINNPGDGEALLTVEYILFPSRNTDTPLTPDPVLGFDIARDCPSKTIHEGKVVAKTTLTDNNRGSRAYVRPVRGKKKVYKVTQIIELKKVVKPIALKIKTSDANWIYTLNVSGSVDGKKYKPINSLQGIDLFHKWQPVKLDVDNCPEVRFLRFEYDTEGVQGGPIGPGKVTQGSGASHFSMPCMIKVYDGLNDEPRELPKVDELIAEGRIECKAAPGQFAASPLLIKAGKIPGEGCYVLGMKISKPGSPAYIVYRKVYFWKPHKIEKDGIETRFGVNAANLDNADKLRAMGFSMVRFENSKWFMLSNEPNKLNFHGVPPWRVNLDKFLTKYSDIGLNPLPLMLGVPKWASSKPEAKRCFFYPPANPDSYKEFAFQFAARYGSKKIPASELQSNDKKSGMNLLKYFEIWNEPDLNHRKWGALIGKFQDFYPIIRAGYEGVKKADPDAVVLNGGLAGFHFELWEEMRTYKYPDGKCPLDFIDVMNIHYYCGKRSPEQGGANTNINRHGKNSDEPSFSEKVKRLAHWRDKNKPGAEIWLTEMGWDTIGGRFVSEKQQACYLVRASIIALASGIDKFFVYREADSGRSLYASCGFIRKDKSWKPSTFAYSYMLKRLKQAKIIGEIANEDEFVKTYLVKSLTGKCFLVAWNCDDQGGIKSKKQRWLNLKSQPEAVYDSFGCRIKCADKVPLGMFPVYIDLTDEGAEYYFKQAAAFKQAEKTAYKKNAERKFIMLDFGGSKYVAQRAMGTLRKGIAVPFDSKWDGGKNEFGFVKGAVKNEFKHWRRKDALRCDSVRCKKKMVFKVKLPKGKYEMCIGFSPFTGSTAKLKVSLDGKQQLSESVRCPSNNWVSNIKKEINCTRDGAVLTISTSKAYCMLYFLTFTEIL